MVVWSFVFFAVFSAIVVADSWREVGDVEVTLCRQAVVFDVGRFQRGRMQAAAVPRGIFSESSVELLDVRLMECSAIDGFAGSRVD